MKILGIENRTENWKTAYYFAPFFRCKDARLRLARRLGEPDETQASEVCINLFWYGIRDHFASDGIGDEKDLAERYDCLFPHLSNNILSFSHLQTSQSFNYNPSQANQEVNLRNNLGNTEIDIVLETPNHLFIGEAKHETGFDNSDTSDVLVHQLIRQYVTTKVLLNILGNKKKVVQFVVADDRDHTMNFGQVKFLLQQCWMSENNVLTWKDIKEFWPPLTANGALPNCPDTRG